LKQIFSAVIITILIFITGCAGLIQKKPLTLDNLTIAEIRHRIEQNNLKYHSMKANAEISVESAKVNFSAKSNIKIKKPDSLLMTIKAPFGIGFGTVFIDQNQFLVYNSFDNTVYTGDPQKLKRTQFLPIDIKLENIFQAFSGIQLIDFFDRDSLAIDHNKYLVIGSKDNQTMKYWIDPKRFVVTEFQLWNKRKKPLVVIEYKQFEKKDQILLPKLIQITQPGQSTRLTILYTDREPNCLLSPKDFEIKIPEQAVKIEL
jgi:outer membrane lipoprotein-sorting protein